MWHAGGYVGQSVGTILYDESHRGWDRARPVSQPGNRRVPWRIAYHRECNRRRHHGRHCASEPEWVMNASPDRSARPSALLPFRLLRGGFYLKRALSWRVLVGYTTPWRAVR